MSVPVPKRTSGELEINTLARSLCVYTLQITDNEKNFPGCRSFVENVRDAALEIHMLCWRANNIRVSGDAERYAARMEAQNKAADRCNDLYALIEIAKPLYHMSSKRAVYWQGLVVGVRNSIRAWHESDAKRLRPEEKELSIGV